MAAALTLAVLLGVGALVRFRSRLGARLLTLGVTTALATLAFGWIYFVGFERGDCSVQDPACMFNANQGLLTFFALSLALGTFWISFVVDSEKERRVKQERRKHAMRALDEAVYEVHHNLQHAANATTANGFRHFPEISVERVNDVCSPAIRSLVHPELVRLLDLTLRNHGRMAQTIPTILPENSLPLEIVERIQEEYDVPILKADKIKPNAEASAFWREAEQQRATVIFPLIAQQVHFLMLSFILDIHATRHLEHPQLTALGERMRTSLENLNERGQVGPYYYHGLASHAEADVPAIRNETLPLLCWYKDRTFENTEIIEVSRIFLDRARGRRR